tara:strand:- start:16 stop:627 length:612 start_codon:yes stop_codon:yes gene_type:complete
MQAIQASLSSHGQVEPLLIQKSSKMVIAGNGRMASMKRLGWETADCVVLDVDDIEARKLSIALNRSGELASWDEKILTKHLDDLSDLEDFDLAKLGFNSDEVDEMLSDLAKVVDEVALEADQQDEDENQEEETSEHDDVIPPNTQPANMKSAKMKELKVFLDPDDYTAFQMAIRTLAERYGTDNTSDTIQRAIKNELDGSDEA